jgi:hypothetical protein
MRIFTQEIVLLDVLFKMRLGLSKSFLGFSGVIRISAVSLTPLKLEWCRLFRRIRSHMRNGFSQSPRWGWLVKKTRGRKSRDIKHMRISALHRNLPDPPRYIYKQAISFSFQAWKTHCMHTSVHRYIEQPVLPVDAFFPVSLRVWDSIIVGRPAIHRTVNELPTRIMHASQIYFVYIEIVYISTHIGIESVSSDGFRRATRMRQTRSLQAPL